MEENKTFIIEYTMTKKEVMDFCRYMRGLTHKNARNGCIFIMGIFVGMFLLPMTQGTGEVQLPWLACGIMAPVFFILFHEVSVRRVFKRLENGSLMRKQWLVMSEGFLYYPQSEKMIEGSRYRQEKGTRQLFVYAEVLPDGKQVYGVIPKRAFASAAEMEAFAAAMKNPCDENKRAAKLQEFERIKVSREREKFVSQETSGKIQNPKEFLLFVPPELLPAVYVELNQILFLFKKQSRKRRAWSIALIMIMTIGLCLFDKVSIPVMAAMMTAAFSLCNFASRRVFGSGQLRMYDRQMRYGLLPKNLLGNWNIWIGDDGYRTLHNDFAKNVSCREKHRVFQTGLAYYILDEKMEQSDLFLKSMFADESQRREWESRCREWGWSLETLDQKRIKKNANVRWAALIVSICAVLAAFFLTVFQAFYEFNELYLSEKADYSASVSEEHIHGPHDIQVQAQEK